MPVNARLGLPSRLGQELRELSVGESMLLAVSGGADSVALMRSAARIADAEGVRLVVGHLDHQLRPDSDADAEWVDRQANALGLDCRIGHADVADQASRTRRGLEETARRLRYDWLAEIAGEVGAGDVATAHTADDAAETILFHLLRGTGLAGLRGIARTRRLAGGIRLIRPMLPVSRADVLAYLAEIGQDFREDPTNADRSITRNRLRNEILPALREAVNPRADSALIRLSRQARETEGLLAGIARGELRRSLLESGPERIRIRTWQLAARRPIVIRETLRLAWRRADWPRQAMTARHWHELAEIVRDGGARTLPDGVDARREKFELVLRRTLSR